MNYNENPALYTLLQLAIRAGRDAVAALQGDMTVCMYEFPNGLEAWDDEPVEASPRLKSDLALAGRGHDECLCDYRLAPKRERGSLRMNLRTPIKPRAQVFDEVRFIEAAQRFAVDQYTEEQLRMEANLRGYCRTLYRDVQEAYKRCFHPDVLSTEFTEEQWERMQRLVDFLEELMSQEKIDTRLRLHVGAQSAWVRQPYGLSLDELEDAIMAADSRTFV